MVIRKSPNESNSILVKFQSRQDDINQPERLSITLFEKIRSTDMEIKKSLDGPKLCENARRNKVYPISFFLENSKANQDEIQIKNRSDVLLFNNANVSKQNDPIELKNVKFNEKKLLEEKIIPKSALSSKELLLSDLEAAVDKLAFDLPPKLPNFETKKKSSVFTTDSLEPSLRLNFKEKTSLPLKNASYHMKKAETEKLRPKSQLTREQLLLDNLATKYAVKMNFDPGSNANVNLDVSKIPSNDDFLLTDLFKRGKTKTRSSSKINVIYGCRDGQRFFDTSSESYRNSQSNKHVINLTAKGDLHRADSLTTIGDFFESYKKQLWRDQSKLSVFEDNCLTDDSEIECDLNSLEWKLSLDVQEPLPVNREQP